LDKEIALRIDERLRKFSVNFFKQVGVVDVVFSLKEGNFLKQKVFSARIEIMEDLKDGLFFAFVIPTPINGDENPALELIKCKLNRAVLLFGISTSPEDAVEKAFEELNKHLKELNLLEN